MPEIYFNKTKDFIYRNCVRRVENKRLEKKLPQIALCRDDKTLVSYFFNCKLTSNNQYLVTKKLLDYTSDIIGSRTGAVPIFEFENIHEVLWGNDKEFEDNLSTIFSLLVFDILDSSTKDKDFLEYVLCDNIIYSKYFSFRNIKDKYNVSLLENFAVYDELVNDQHMSNYLDIAIKYLYHKPAFHSKFKEIFLFFTKSHDDYTHIDDRLYKEFIPNLYELLDNYKPTATSLGIRVKNLIDTDIIKAIEQIDALKNNPDFLNTPEAELNKQIVNASSTYICKLEDIALSSENSGVYFYGW